VTGLYPGNHGIISNNILDREMNKEFHLADRVSLVDPRWWGGEPIWVTAEKQGLVTATMFWPGSELEIGGVRPTYWFPYDSTITFEERVEQVLQWVDLPTADRPRLMTLYFEEPNDTSHEFGPESQQTREVLKKLDVRIGDLVEGLRQRELTNHVNLIIVSDHGFSETDPARIVFLDDYVELEKGEVFELGAILQIFPNEGRRELIFEALKGAHPNLSIYLSEDIPDRYHLKQSPRTPPILGVPDAGWEVETRRHWEKYEAVFTKGDHGQDPRDPILHGIFVANGPAFRSGLTVERFDLVEIYNLMTSVLELEPIPNDGEPGKLDPIINR
jgi:predicted AlkP superfamily pyrophosphatase or phosphodiesterase